MRRFGGMLAVDWTLLVRFHCDVASMRKNFVKVSPMRHASIQMQPIAPFD
jgi:hypothetical protein